jgi:hypothetical protein
VRLVAMGFGLETGPSSIVTCMGLPPLIASAPGPGRIGRRQAPSEPDFG